MHVTSIGKDIREVPEAQEFIESSRRNMGPECLGGQSYEAANILIDAARRAASDPMRVN